MTAAQRYDVLGRVATTRSGAVWKARDLALDRLVALKQIAAANRDVLYREASAIAALANEHIVEVYGIEEDGSAAYLVEEWVDGATVAAVVRANGAMPPAQALSVIRGALLGLDAAHRAGLVHGDVSMSNILVDAYGRARLIDFGSVSPTGAAAQPTTGAFAAPELLAGYPATPAADVYASAGVLAALLHGRIERSPSTNGVAGPIKDVLDRALRGSPGERYPNAGALLAALEDAATKTYGLSWWSQAGLGAAATATVAVLVPIGAAAAGAAGAATVAGAGSAAGAGGAAAVGATGATSGATATAASSATAGSEVGAGLGSGAAHLGTVGTSAAGKGVGSGVGKGLGKIAWHSRRLWIAIGTSAAVAAGGAAIAVTVAKSSNNSPQAGSGAASTSTSSPPPVSGTSTPSGPAAVTASFSIKIGDLVSPGHPAPGAGTVKANEAQDYKLAGTKGTVLFFHGGPAPCTIGTARYEVLRPDGSTTYWGSDACADIGRETLDATGTWTVRVTGETGGDFSFAVTPVNGSGGNTLALGDTRSGMIKIAGQRDVYKLPGMKVGQVVYLEGANSKSCVSGKISIEIRRPDGSSAYFGSDACNNPGRYVVDAAGTWQIVASGEDNGADTGAYTFTILGVTDQNADTAIGQTVSGNLDAIGAFHSYRFSANAGQIIYLEGQTASGCTAGLVEYELRMPDGSSAYFGSDICNDAGRYVIKSTGTWSVRVYGAENGHDTGPYRFHLYPVSDTTSAYGIGRTASGTLSGVGAFASYTFAAQTGQVIYLEGQTASGCTAGLVEYELRMPDGSSAYFGSDICNNAGRYVIKSTGTWSVRVYGADNGHDTGPYRFHIYSVGDKTFSIAIGQTVTGQLAGIGEFDNYRFTATAGQKITLQGDSSTSCVAGKVEYALYMPDGSSAYIGSDSCGSSGTYTITKGGTWTVRVYGADNGYDTGSYQLTIKNG